MKTLALLCACLAAAVAAQAARADGDPASDYLLGSKVFLPYDAKFPAKQSAELTALVAAANTAGFKIRVAVIWSDYDMGSVTTLWRKPRTYAKFLGLELGFVYKQRLLVVMANGFGFNWPRHSPAPGYAILSKIADFYEEEVDAAVSSLTSIIEPLMMIGVGIMVGTIILSMYLPMFKLLTLVK